MPCYGPSKEEELSELRQKLNTNSAKLQKEINLLTSLLCMACTAIYEDSSIDLSDLDKWHEKHKDWDNYRDKKEKEIKEYKQKIKDDIKAVIAIAREIGVDVNE